MLDVAVIEKNEILQKSEDYAALRKAGVEHIQRLSGKVWTDHNLHDPGITSLEILAYALTDLGYRTSFDIRDLLTPETGMVEPPSVSGLFPAHEVLTMNPLTIFDYRKLLLRIEGVRNAWLDPMTDPAKPETYRQSEIPIYADYLKDTLTFADTNAAGNDTSRVRLSGLYAVLLELEIDDELGSLNESRLVFTVPTGDLKGVVLAVDSKDPAFHAGDIDFDRDFDQLAAVDSISPSGANFDVDLRIQVDGGNEVALSSLRITIVSAKPDPTADPLPVSSADITDVLAATELLAFFWKKQRIRQLAIDSVCCVLDAHRNLCEDFLSVNTVKPDKVAVCVDIEVEPKADIESVLANVYHEIELYFNPPISYFTLDELLDEGLCPDEIFRGPYVDFGFECRGERVFTKPGFVKDENLALSELRQTIYSSDIINILMDLDGVVAIRNLMLRKYDDDGNPVGGSEKWCLQIAPNRQPFLYIEKSKVVFYKAGLPYRAKSGETEQTLEHLRAMALKAAYVAPDQVLDLPTGVYREPGTFYSIQHDFPKTYGVGKVGLPANVDDERVAQARQFKGYLTFFDQMLADYLAQLANVGRLFSLDKSLEQTYFSQYLKEIAPVRLPAFEDEFYVDKTVLEPLIDRGRITENEEIFQDRRNRALDHLIARFAEQFTDYVLMMFDLQGDPLKTGKRLIDDKIDFLSEYPLVSRERAKAFNYRPQDPADQWDTDNIAGLKRRVSRLLGIDDIERRDLHCVELFDALFSTRKIGPKFHVEIKTASNVVIFRSTQGFNSRAGALNRARQVFPGIRLEPSYEITASGTQTIFRIRYDGKLLANSKKFDTQADAMVAIRSIIDRYDELLTSLEVCNDEGFHLFEHILLRPFVDTDELMPVCLEPDCPCSGEDDPYSFRITVILPYWPERFRTMNFRRFFERTLREETPAHIHARICWISTAQMQELDAKYRAWLAARSEKDFDQTTLTETLRDLIICLGKLRTIYPATTLHDCAEGEDENPVRLGSTNLGIF